MASTISQPGSSSQASHTHSKSRLARSTDTLSCSDETTFPCPQDKDDSEPPRPCYVPKDLRKIQWVLRHLVPTELADMIMREAELFPYVDCRRNAYSAPRYALEAPDGDAQWSFLISPPVPSLTRDGAALPTKVHKVKFSIKAYRSQWNPTPSFDFRIWFEACVLKGDQASTYVDGTDPMAWYTSLTPSPNYINTFVFDERHSRVQSNPLDRLERFHIVENPQHKQGEWHEIEWCGDDMLPCMDDGKSTASFINGLEVGDRVLLFARAQNPGWIDQVFHAKIEIMVSLDSQDSV